MDSNKRMHVKLFLGIALFLLIFWGNINPSIAQTPPPGSDRPIPLLKTGDFSVTPYDINAEQNNALEAKNSGVEGITSAIDWHLVVYQAFVDDNWDIFTQYLDGSNVQNITNNPANDGRPKLDKGATRVVFNSNRDGNTEIYSVNVDGSNLLRLTNNAGEDYAPAWSPDGTQIAFVASRDGNDEIYIMNANGTNPQRLTSNKVDDRDPSWSPDGKQITWVSCIRYCAIWIMNIDGSNAHALTKKITNVQHPIMSPDGTRIAFDGDLDDDYLFEIGVLDLSDNSIQNFCDSSYSVREAWVGAWSSDGEFLLGYYFNYLLQGDYYVLDRISLERFTMIGTAQLISTPYNYSAYGDWQLADIDAPTSSIFPLPDYLRAFGFLVSWIGNDIGVSGIKSYDIQQNISSTNQWSDWIAGTPTTTAHYSGIAGDGLNLRIRAVDNAGNVGKWNNISSGVSYLYKWEFKGSLIDNRGIPLSLTQLGFNPSPINKPETKGDGTYNLYLKNEGNHSFSVNRSGFSSINPQSLSVNFDQSRIDYLSPVDNLVQNGGFEQSGSSLNHWEISGTIPITLTNASHTDSHAVALGSYCTNPPCLGVETKDFTYHSASMAADSLGNLHVVFSLDMDFGENHKGIFYTVRDSAGNWSTPFLLSDSLVSSETRPEIAFGPDGTLHVLWDHCYGCYTFYLHYMYKTIDGGWSPIEHLGNAERPQIVIDSQGVIHMVYQTGSKMNYRERLTDGTWTESIRFDNSDGYGNAIAITPDDTIHVLWVSYKYGTRYINYQYKDPRGVWSEPEQIASNGNNMSSNFYDLNLVSDSFGQLHAVMTNLYTVRDAKGHWSNPITLPLEYISTEIIVDKQGVLHLVGESGSGLYYQVRKVDGNWSMTNELLSKTFYDTAATSISLILDGADIPHTVYCDSYSTKCSYRSSPLSGTSGMGNISQTITIPGTMHKPTLSFLYKTMGIIHGTGTHFFVSVTDNLTTTVFSAAESLDWTHGFVPMDSWGGQTITLTFHLQQASGNPYAFVSLDDVSLGSWLTPQVFTVSPDRLQMDTSQTITITGNNFVPTPSIRLGDSVITDVQWIDEHTIRVLLPPDVSVGIQDLWVINPQGQEGVLPRSLFLGKFNYLPILSK